MSNIPRKEYPRPQFVRENWMNLNGTWAFEIDNGRSGEARGLQKVGHSAQRRDHRAVLPGKRTFRCAAHRFYVRRLV